MSLINTTIVIITGLSIFLGLYSLHKICLWLESKGWLYYKNKKSRGGFAGNAFLEINALFSAGTKEVIELKQNEAKLEQNEAWVNRDKKSNKKTLEDSS